MGEGIADELRGISLGDERLNRRSRKVIEALAANPEASVNAAMNGWADTQAAYRLFSNPNVSAEQILEPHRQATQCRISEHPVVLLVQDTTELDTTELDTTELDETELDETELDETELDETELDETEHPTRDALCLNREERFGLYHHVQLALTPAHLPLGVIATESFDREPETLGKRPRQTGVPIEDKESYRRLQGYRRAGALAAQCPQTQIVSVADSEADIYDIFVAAQQQTGPRADYLIRADEDRSTPERNPAVSRRTYHKVRDQVADSPVRTRYIIELCATPQRAARQATLAVRAISVAVKSPNARNHLPDIRHNVILVEEVDGPGDGTEVSWLLMTTLPIETVEDVRRAMDYYVARWGIETYFRTLKTGCQVERIQLETKSRLLNCLAFYNIIAWRILYLTYLNRTRPDLPCTAVFADHEWKPVWRIVRKEPLPKQPPPLCEFMQLITHLGGYNNRPSEKPAGPQPVWLGLRRMLDYSAAWLAFESEADKKCV